MNKTRHSLSRGSLVLILCFVLPSGLEINGLVTPRPHQFNPKFTNIEINSLKPTQKFTNLEINSLKPTQKFSNLEIYSPKPTDNLSNLMINSPKPTEQFSKLEINSPKPTEKFSNLKINNPKPTEKFSNLEIKSLKPNEKFSILKIDSLKSTAKSSSLALNSPKSPHQLNCDRSETACRDEEGAAYSENEANDEVLTKLGFDDVENLDRSSATSMSPIFHWCLLEISGNKSVARTHRDDFIKHLKINTAKLTNSMYEKIIFNGVTFNPEILVNLSLDWRLAQNTLKVMNNLVASNETILELFGEQFALVSFKDSDAILTPKPIVIKLTSREVESLIYIAMGGLAAFVVFSIFLIATYHCQSKRKKNRTLIKANNLYINGKSNKMERSPDHKIITDDPNLIYKEGHYSDNLTPLQFSLLDENLYSISMKDDSTTQDINEESKDADPQLSSSLLSTSGHLSSFADDTIDSDSTQPPVLSDLSDERTSLMDHQSTTPSPRPKPPNSKTSSSSLFKNRPPRPPNRFNSLQPKTRTRPHQKSCATTRAYTSRPGFKLSVPAPNHLSSVYGSTCSLTSPPRPCSVPADFINQRMSPSQEQINEDVKQVFDHFGLNC